MKIMFVCQSGILEIQSILLAASIKRLSPQHELVAAVCEDFGDINRFTYKLLDMLGVEIKHIKNDYCPKYPVGNKTIASCLYPGLFLDTDVICMRPFDELHGVQVISTGRYDVISNKEWRDIHKLFDLQFKHDFKHVRSPFVVCDDSDFSKSWNDNCHKLWNAIHSGLFIRRIRQVDQISLTITVQQYNSTIHSWSTNQYLLSPSEIYTFDNGLPIKNNCPPFLVLQKGWLYYKRQGEPREVSENPNSLAYYPEIRSTIYSILTMCPDIDRHPLWPMLYDLYFSHEPLPEERMREIICGVEKSMK